MPERTEEDDKALSLLRRQFVGRFADYINSQGFNVIGIILKVDKAKNANLRIFDSSKNIYKEVVIKKVPYKGIDAKGSGLNSWSLLCPIRGQEEK